MPLTHESLTSLETLLSSYVFVPDVFGKRFISLNAAKIIRCSSNPRSQPPGRGVLTQPFPAALRAEKFKTACE